MISTVAEASQCLLVVTDADGVILWREDAGRVRLRAGIHGPLLLTDPGGWVAHSVGLPVRERVAAPGRRPSGRRPRHRAVHARARRGRLAAPPAWAGDHDPAPALDLVGSPAVEVTRRRGAVAGPAGYPAAEILLLHGAGRAGLCAAALSSALFSDTEHVVTARAEVSGCARSSGPVVSTQPYRLADGVEMTLRTGTEQWWDSAFVQASTAPGLRGSAPARPPATG